MKGSKGYFAGKKLTEEHKTKIRKSTIKYIETLTNKNFKCRYNVNACHFINKLNEGSIPLDESITLYEEGIKTAKECISYLNENKEKIDNLTKQMETLFAGEDNV